MGKGYLFECAHCGKIFSVFPGAGVAFSTVYGNIMDGVRRGDYGDELQSISQELPFFAVDAESYLFKCSGCGYWEVGPGLSLYAPNNLKAYIQRRYGQNTIAGWNKESYVTFNELQSNFHVIKRYLHPCPKCGKRMRKADKETDFLSLPCPGCGTECTAEVKE